VEKTDPNALYEEFCRIDRLQTGWAKVLANGGGPGGDGVSLHDFGARLEAEIARLAFDLAHGLYRPGPLRRTQIPKRHGGTRPLAIPCVRDRVAQSALHLLLSPLLETEFEDSSFGYRPGRGVRDALERVQALHRQGYAHVVEADIDRFFENVPHAPLLERLGASIADPRVVAVVALWLAQEPGGRGLAQGSPLSPLLSNLYLDALDEGLEGRGVRIVRFADDFVILCKSAGLAEETLGRARATLGELGLALDLEKTRLTDFDRGFRFLGHKLVKSFVLAEQEEAETAERPVFEPSSGGLTQPATATPSLAASAPPVATAPAMRGDALPDEGWRPEAPAKDDAHDLSPVTRVLYLMHPARRLTVQGEAFAVMEDEAVVAVFPPRRLGRIEIGPDARADEAALRHALAWSIPVAYVTQGGATRGLVLGPTERHGRLHLAQAGARLDAARALLLASAFADSRMRNQRALLNRLNRRRDDEEVRAAAHWIGRVALKLRVAEDVESARGIEGEATSAYWPAFGRMLAPAFAIAGRRRDPVGGPTDLLLNFAAHLLTRDVETLVLRHGLHPGIGFLHGTREQPGPLAWDLVEAFRAPLVEGLVAYALNNRVIGATQFFRNAEDHWGIAPDGREAFVRAYEAWLDRPIRNPRRGGETLWRGLIEDDVLALREALLTGGAFTAYRMDY